MSIDAERLQFYQAFTFTFGVTAFIATTAWWRSRRRVRELTERNTAKQREDLDVHMLQGLLDDLAIEVERIGEGQRFLTKMLLAETPTHRDRSLRESADGRLDSR